MYNVEKKVILVYLDLDWAILDTEVRDERFQRFEYQPMRDATLCHRCWRSRYRWKYRDVRCSWCWYTSTNKIPGFWVFKIIAKENAENRKLTNHRHYKIKHSCSQEINSVPLGIVQPNYGGFICFKKTYL